MSGLAGDRYLGSTLVDLSRPVKSDARYRARFRSPERSIGFVSICRTRSYGTRNGLERAREHSARGFRVRSSGGSSQEIQ